MRTLTPQERVSRAVDFLARQQPTPEMAAQTAESLNAWASDRRAYLEARTWAELLSVLVQAGDDRGLWSSQVRSHLDKVTERAQNPWPRRIPMRRRA